VASFLDVRLWHRDCVTPRRGLFVNWGTQISLRSGGFGSIPGPFQRRRYTAAAENVHQISGITQSAPASQTQSTDRQAQTGLGNLSTLTRRDATIPWASEDFL
jgi:hypothetical protein